jgi:hypothetical protein
MKEMRERAVRSQRDAGTICQSAGAGNRCRTSRGTADPPNQPQAALARNGEVSRRRRACSLWIVPTFAFAAQSIIVAVAAPP